MRPEKDPQVLEVYTPGNAEKLETKYRVRPWRRGIDYRPWRYFKTLKGALDYVKREAKRKDDLAASCFYIDESTHGNTRGRATRYWETVRVVKVKRKKCTSAHIA